MPDDGSENCSVSKWIIITETCECGYSESPDDKKKVNMLTAKVQWYYVWYIYGTFWQSCECIHFFMWN